MIGSRGLRPGDILTASNGKTIEASALKLALKVPGAQSGTHKLARVEQCLSREEVATRAKQLIGTYGLAGARKLVTVEPEVGLGAGVPHMWVGGGGLAGLGWGFMAS